MVERWKTILSPDRFIMPGVLPPGSGAELRLAAAECHEALAPAGARAIEGELMSLRSSTILRNETAAESKASLKAMVGQLSFVPIDIFRRACRDYTAAPGQRFFPRSAGELLEFVNPRLQLRRNAAQRLRIMADAADAADARRAERERGKTIDPRSVAETNRLMLKFQCDTRFDASGHPYVLGAGMADPALPEEPITPENSSTEVVP